MLTALAGTSVIMPAFEVKARLAVQRVRRNLQACAAAHQETGAPITVHTQGQLHQMLVDNPRRCFEPSN